MNYFFTPFTISLHVSSDEIAHTTLVTIKTLNTIDVESNIPDIEIHQMINIEVLVIPTFLKITRHFYNI